MRTLTLLCTAALAASLFAPMVHAADPAVAAISKKLPDGSFYTFASSITDRPAFCAGAERWVILVSDTAPTKEGCYVQNPATQDVVIRWADGSYSFVASDQIRHNRGENR